MRIVTEETVARALMETDSERGDMFWECEHCDPYKEEYRIRAREMLSYLDEPDD